MKRITVIHRWYWKPSHRAGSSQVYEVAVLYDLTDKALEKKITELNAGFRTSTWSVKHDFKLNKKSDQKDYLKYCLEAYYEPHTYDHDSCEVASKMIEAIRERYPDLK